MGYYSAGRMGESVARALAHWNVLPPLESAPAPARPRITVAICREAGTNGITIARKLGEKLGWPVYDRELLEHIAQEWGLSTHLLESIDEKRLGLLRSYFEAFTSNHPLSESVYLTHLVKVLLSLAAHGNCILVGRGAAQFLPAETTLRVRLVAPLARRVQNVCEKFGATTEEATRRIRTTDHDRDQFLRDNFHKDPAVASNYDLVLNVSRYSVEECATLIEQALKCFHAPAAGGEKTVPAPALAAG